MKKFPYLVIVLAILTLLSSCKSEPKQTYKPSTKLEPEMIVTGKDTAAVRSLCAQFFKTLKEKDLKGAISMLRYYDSDSIAPLPAPLAAKEAMTLGMFLGMKYEIEHIIFFRDDDSEVKYTVTMFEKTDPKDKRPNTTSFLIRPVRYHGEWYITLADKTTDQVKSQIKH